MTKDSVLDMSKTACVVVTNDYYNSDISGTNSLVHIKEGDPYRKYLDIFQK